MESDESIDAGNDQDVREEEDKDEIGEVLSEWKNHSEFKVRKFYRWLFPSALFSIYSLVAHTFLGVKYLNTGFILQSQNFTTDNPSCRNLTVEVLSNHSDWSDKRFYADHLYTCQTQNLVFGIATLSIQFLPGIQWYTTLKVTKKHRLGRFLSSLLFPFFSILFKVTFKAIDFFLILLLLQIAHCFHQGPKTARMASKVTSCKAVLKTMVQLVLQAGLTNNFNLTILC